MQDAPENPKQLDVENFKAYDEAKHRRFNLLFAVNGGAFAIVKLLMEGKITESTAVLLRNLTFCCLSVAMIVFTVVMVLEIHKFRKKAKDFFPEHTLTTPGMVVVILIGSLICLAWGIWSVSLFIPWG